jgi:hypothetical protein
MRRLAILALRCGNSGVGFRSGERGKRTRYPAGKVAMDLPQMNHEAQTRWAGLNMFELGRKGIGKPVALSFA